MQITLYVIRGFSSGRRYVGITKDLNRRLREHRSGRSRSGRLIGDFGLVHTELFETYGEARERERFLKSGQGRAWLDEKLGNG